MAEQRSKILETQMTVSFGMSVNMDGDWVKTAHDVSVKVSAYPDDEMFTAVSKRMMHDAMVAASEQIDTIHAKIHGGANG